jgi:hypothetical protein
MHRTDLRVLHASGAGRRAAPQLPRSRLVKAEPVIPARTAAWL